MCQSNPIPQMDTIRRPLNIPIRPPRQSIQRRKPRPESTGSLESLPLKLHPKLPYFILDLNEMIQTHAPSLRPHFLPLRERVDSGQS